MCLKHKGYGGLMHRLLLLIIALFLFPNLNTHAKTKEDPTIEWNRLANKNINRLLEQGALRSYTPEEIKHLRWVSKASLFLRGRKELSFEQDNIEKLKTMSKEEVVNHFMSQDDFNMALLDFSLYYIGFSLDDLKVSGDQFNPQIYNYGPTLSAVQAVSRNQSFDTLFNTFHPLYIEPLDRLDMSITETFPLDGIEQLDTDVEKKLFFLDYAIKHNQNLSQLSDAELNEQGAKICEFHYNLAGQSNFSSPNLLNKLGLNFPLIIALTDNFKFYPSHCTLNGDFNDDGEFVVTYQLINPTLLKETIPLREKFLKDLKLLVQKYDQDKYQVSSLLDIRYLDPEVHDKVLFFKSGNIASKLQNSSTNMNRRRGAYILKRFFCDDLTPVNVQIPDDHTQGGAHGSNPSCYACHYKLDPMAGFFKDYGLNFDNFSDSQTILFDDFAQQDLNDYQAQWLKPGTNDWNIGYVKSTKNSALNIYGESLEDLSEILKSSPEVKRCMTKKLLQYSTNPEQLFDPGYIDHLAEIYTQQEKTAPQKAVKNLFKTIALSKTFIEEDRLPNECYDLKPGVDTTSRPPCEVAFIIEQNCKSCHQSTFGANSLDLSKWTKLQDGTFGFEHFNESTFQQHPSQHTFQTMLDRITTTDPKKRMPQGQDMDPTYRQILYKWLNEKVK